MADGERNPFRVASSTLEYAGPRVAKAQPWAPISERFQRYGISDAFSFLL